MELHKLYGHDGNGTLKTEHEVIIPNEKDWPARSKAIRESMTDPSLFYTFYREGIRMESAGPVGYRSPETEGTPNYHG